MLRSFVTCGLLFLSAYAWANDGALARIIAVEKTQGATSEVTLRVESGAFYNDSDVELLAPGYKAVARLKLPSGIDMLMEGDEVKRVTLVSTVAKPVAGYVADQGKFANYAAAQRRSGGTAIPKAATPTAAVASPAKSTPTSACPYTAQELGAALGMTLNAGKGSASPFPGGVSYGCSYAASADVTTVYVNQTVMPHDVLVANEKESSKHLAGAAAYLPGDANLARWQTGQGDLTGVVLHYIRDGVQVELRVMPGASFMRDKAKVAAMRARVLKLRRLP